MNGEKFYTYDFVYGKTKLSHFKDKSLTNKIKIKSRFDNKVENLEDYRDMLNKNIQKNSSLTIYQ